ncbi:hypothetical protein HR17_01900 [Porphyromonas gulae]|nr:hypothetical protein HR17_01900 [Porphyromonas gulae]
MKRYISIPLSNEDNDFPIKQLPKHMDAQGTHSTDKQYKFQAKATSASREERKSTISVEFDAGKNCFPDRVL